MFRLLSNLFLTILFFVAALIGLVVLSSASLQAQGYRFGDPIHPSHHRGPSDHGHWAHPRHAPDLEQLDELSDRLATIAEHLHDDAHRLSPDYEHSASIEVYVDQLDRLQQHMHAILHRAVESGSHSDYILDHLRHDVAESRLLLNRLHGELQHQGFDGARPSDYQRMLHMRQVIQHEAFPWLEAMELALHGHRGSGWNHHRIHPAPVVVERPLWTRQIRFGRLQIQF